jgi:acetyl esterase/lipase
MADQPTHPPFDPAYKNASGLPNPSRTFNVPTMRQGMQIVGLNASSIARKHPLYIHNEHPRPSVPGLSDAEVTLALWQLPQTTNPEQALRKRPNSRPVVYYIHGGGQVAGDRFFGPEFVMSHFTPQENIIFASPEYRLAPEHRAPAAAYDLYAGLVFLVENAQELDIDPSKIVLWRRGAGCRCCAVEPEGK